MSTALIKPKWSFPTIALMILGFMFFWPLGFGMLAYILWGEMFGGSSEKAEAFIDEQRRNWQSKSYRRSARSGSGNAAFDAYREEQLRRLEEERRRLDEEIKEFRDHMDNLAKARDREEFDRFMRERRNNHQQDDAGRDNPWSGDNGHRQGY